MANNCPLVFVGLVVCCCSLALLFILHFIALCFSFFLSDDEDLGTAGREKFYLLFVVVVRGSFCTTTSPSIFGSWFESNNTT